MKIRPLHFVTAFLIFLISVEVIYTKLIFSSEVSAYIMGTPLRVKINGPNSPHLAQRGLWEIKKIDRLFSIFKPDSEINRINKLAGRAPLQVSPDTFECLRIAQKINALSRKAFDITLGKPWALKLDSQGRTVFLERQGVQIDLGGIGKGYAAESARRLLLKKGAKSGMIDMRSSIAVFGDKVWQVGIQHPRNSEKLLGKIELKNGQSLATSGDYERGEHILDPRTGEPAKLCRAVTIIGQNAAETDALATAVFVLGPRQGLKLIESLPKVEGLIVDSKGDVVYSSGFDMQ